MTDFILLLLIICVSCAMVWGQASTTTTATPTTEDIVTSNNITFYIEHALGDNRSFLPRTKVQLIMMSDGRQGLKYLDKNIVTDQTQLSNLRQLLASNELYTIRIRAEKEDWKGKFVLSSLPACELQKSGFKEDLQVFLGANGNIIGVSYNVPKMAIAQECDASKIKDALPFMTKIKLGEEQVAQSIPLQINSGRPHYLQNIKLQADVEDESVKPKQQQSFLQRYWYIVVGLVMYLFVGGAGPEPAKQDGKDGAKQGDGAKASAGGATTAPQQAPSSSSRPKKE